MRKLFANMDIKLKAPTCAQLPSVEAGDSNKDSRHLTCLVIILSKHFNALTNQSFSMKFENMTSFAPYHCLVGNV